MMKKLEDMTLQEVWEQVNPVLPPSDYVDLPNGVLVTTTAAADQVVAEYVNATGRKNMYLLFLYFEALFTAINAAATILGTISLEAPLGVKKLTRDMVNPTSSTPDVFSLIFQSPVLLQEAKNCRVVVTPASATSITWRATLGIALKDQKVNLYL